MSCLYFVTPTCCSIFYKLVQTVAQFLSLFQHNQNPFISHTNSILWPVSLSNLLFSLYWVSDSRTFVGGFFCVKKITDLFGIFLGLNAKANWVSRVNHCVSENIKKSIFFFLKGPWFLNIYLVFCVKISDLFELFRGLNAKSIGFLEKLEGSLILPHLLGYCGKKKLKISDFFVCFWGLFLGLNAKGNWVFVKIRF